MPSIHSTCPFQRATISSVTVFLAQTPTLPSVTSTTSFSFSSTIHSILATALRGVKGSIMFRPITTSSTLRASLACASRTPRFARSISSTVSRHYADVVEAPKPGDASSSSKPEFPKEGALRPHLNIKTDPNHGLYGFFRKVEKDGEVSYETIEVALPESMEPGTSRHAYFSSKLPRLNLYFLCRSFMDCCRTAS